MALSIFHLILLVELRYNDDDGEFFKSFLEPRWDYLTGDDDDGEGGQSPGRHPKIPLPNVEQQSRGPRPAKLWISMGLCYSENTRLFSKSKYPYAEVTPLAVLLWRHFAPDAGVLVRIVYTGEGDAFALFAFPLRQQILTQNMVSFQMKFPLLNYPKFELK